MANKTFKIGEWCKGGIIEAQVNKTTIVLIGKDWDFSAGSNKSSNQSNAKEFTRETYQLSNERWINGVWEWLNDMTSYYYAEKVLDWINSKLPESQRKQHPFW